MSDDLINRGDLLAYLDGLTVELEDRAAEARNESLYTAAMEREAAVFYVSAIVAHLKTMPAGSR